MAGVLLLDPCEVFIEDDALGARDDSKSLAAHAADQRKPGFLRQLDAPRGEA